MKPTAKPRATPSGPGPRGAGPQMESLIGGVLLAGVLTSVALIVAGSLWHLAKTGRLATEHTLAGMNVAELAATEVKLALSGELRPRLLVDLGMVVLLLTPLARVMTSVFYFAAQERNRKYTAITLTVLAVLSYSLFLR
jgi:uncharacterized membrane protein